MEIQRKREVKENRRDLIKEERKKGRAGTEKLNTNTLYN